MFSSLPHCIIKCQRKSTSKKSGHSLIWTIIRKLPLRIKNLMRIAEAKFLKNRPQSSEVYIDSYALNMLAVSKRVLIVDDAVDSGTTLSSVIASINKLEGERMIKSAVITITTSDPKIMPEYSLFNNETLIRFPWAKDN